MSENEVRAASEKFYAALNSMLNGDATPMGGIWSHDAGVTTMHPVGGRETGWDDVRDTWERVAQVSSGGDVRLDEQEVRVAGDAAYESGVERGSYTLSGQEVAVEGRVTNIYRRDGGEWRIVHHHADVSREMIAALGPAGT
ncbi:MAG TPA: nuclear transport factor 2 family protein [Thermohalobaculum sp.]|nr:nuclear transport factor 2 family protein [Thermohalobaculum sp.]